MAAVSAGRALLHAVRRRRDEGWPGGAVDGPPVFWGRIGDYEAVTRHGVLFLLSPEPAHPSRRVSGAPRFSTEATLGRRAGS